MGRGYIAALALATEAEQMLSEAREEIGELSALVEALQSEAATVGETSAISAVYAGIQDISKSSSISLSISFMSAIDAYNAREN